MSFELKPYTFAEIVTVFRDGSRDEELDRQESHSGKRKVRKSASLFPA